MRLVFWVMLLNFVLNVLMLVMELQTTEGLPFARISAVSGWLCAVFISAKSYRD